MRKNHKRLYYLPLSLAALTASAQESAVYTNEYAAFNHAVALYNEEQYLAAQILFNKIKAEKKETNKEIEADCAYYIANCAIRLDQPRAEDMIDEFVMNYPTSSKQNQAYVEVTKYYFDKGEFTKSLKYAQKVKEYAISNQRVLDRFYFHKGYSFFVNKNKKEAKKNLEKIGANSEYKEQAVYYLGYIAYDSDDFEDANKLFEQVESKEAYKEKMGYYQADMSFKSGNFEKAIEQGLEQMHKSTPEERSELSKIIGESYFNLKEYEYALPYLQEYKGKNGKWSNTDFYQLGYAYYKSTEYDKAIEQFNKIISGRDGVAQNAYYHLGESYLHKNQKTQALNAFKNASEMSFDRNIQEDAFLNYGKLSYEIGNPYQSTPSVLTAFLDKYPATPYKTEVEGLLIDSYITSKNFKEALILLEENKGGQNKEAYQKVTFYRGLELFSEGEYQEALQLFQVSLKESHDQKFVARALYWRGEGQFALNRFADSAKDLEDFVKHPYAKETPEFRNVYYNLGYAYFKQKKYDKAIENFQSYVGTNGDVSRTLDAYLRLGDCNFVSGKYWPAMEAYNKVIESGNSDVEYARFQKALCYGFVDRLERKIEDLSAFVQTYPKSNLADDAQYELGVAYGLSNQPDKALRAYDNLRKDYPQSAFISRALLRQGLIHYNADRNDQALLKFKDVASNYSGTPEAVEAVSNARLIYVDSGKVEEYAAWVKGLDFVEVTNADLDNDSFEAAERQYVQNNISRAKEGLQAYLRNFPNGLHALKANFYLGELYFAEKSFDKAASNFEFVREKAHNEFTEVALARLGEIYLSQKAEPKAVEVLIALETSAGQEQNRIFAQSNLMKLYYQQKEYVKAVGYAEKVLQSGKSDNRAKSDAQIIIARAAFQNKDEAKAREAYAQLLKIAKGELAAEALYYDAYFKFKDGDFEASNSSVQKLAKDYSSHKYYGAKGLVLMAKNFYALQDSYQATYILENVIQNFEEFSDVSSEAKQELQRIKNEESKRNSSISK